tara:strand:- start:4308 stop:9446 length:5139 start_codon:yes stop_codon:yes gene_type:complete
MVNKLLKYSVLILILVLLSSSVLSLERGTDNSRVVTYEERVAEPTVDDVEVEDNFFKYVRRGNTYLRTTPSAPCVWKPDHLDDGWCTVEAEFEVKTVRFAREVMAGLNINLINRNRQAKNIQYFYSQDNYNKTYWKRLPNTIDGRRNYTYLVATAYRNYENTLRSLDRDKPISIKVTYEIPKYSTDSFDLNLTGSLSVSIDPAVSSCGTLVSAGTYTLNQSFTATTETQCITIDGQDIILDGAGFSVTSNNFTANPHYGIRITNETVGGDEAKNITIKNITIVNFRDGIQINNPYKNILVENSFFYNQSSVGIVIATYNITLIDNHFETNGSGSHLVTVNPFEGSSYNVLIANNTFNLTTPANQGAMLQVYQSTEVTFENNVGEQTQKSNSLMPVIAIAQTTGWAKNITVRNNIFKNIYKFAVIENSSGIDIINNSFTLADDIHDLDNVKVIELIDYNVDINFSNNIFNGSINATLFNIINLSNSVFFNNVFDARNKSTAFTLSNVSNTLFENNTILRTGTTTTGGGGESENWNMSFSPITVDGRVCNNGLDDGIGGITNAISISNFNVDHFVYVNGSKRIITDTTVDDTTLPYDIACVNLTIAGALDNTTIYLMDGAYESCEELETDLELPPGICYGIVNGVLIGNGGTNDYTYNASAFDFPIDATTITISSGYDDPAYLNFENSSTAPTTVSVTAGFELMTGSCNNNFTNNIFQDATLVDNSGTSCNQRIEYNNTFGQIVWSNLANFTFGTGLKFVEPIIIQDNLIGVDINISYLNLNTTSTISFFSLTYSDTPKLLKDGVRCDDTANCNITSYNSSTGTLVAVVSSFSNYSTFFGDIPTIDGFDGDSTDLGSVADANNVTNLTLENSTVAKIKWLGLTNISGFDLSQLITFSTNSIDVASGQLDSSMNSSAELTIRGLSFSSTPVALKDGDLCSDCEVISWDGANFTFNVTSFSTYTAGGNSQVEIWDSDDIEGGSNRFGINTQIVFFANYTNITDDVAIPGECNISFRQVPSGPFSMTFNTSSLLHEYNRTYINESMKRWNVTCGNSSFETLSGEERVSVGWNGRFTGLKAQDRFPTFTNMQRKIVKDSSGTLHTVYKSEGFDLGYCNSTDNGDSWSCKKLLEASVTDVGIIVKSNDELFVYFDNGQDVDSFNSSDGGATWNSVPNIIDASSNTGDPSCAVDSNDIVHCCSAKNTGVLLYVNSTDWTDIETVNNNSADDTDFCHLEVDNNNCVYILGEGSIQDDLDIWGSCLNGWGDANRVSVFEGTGAHRPNMIIDNSNNIYTVFTYGSGIRLANSTDGGTTWSDKQIVIPGVYPSLTLTDNGDLYVVYATASPTTTIHSPLRYINSSDNGTTWSSAIQIQEEVGYPNVLSSTFPKFNNNTNRLNMVYGGFGEYVYYNNLTVPTLLTASAPVITLGNPGNDTYQTSNPEVTFNVTDANGDNVTVILYGEKGALEPDEVLQTWTNTNATEFSFTWSTIRGDYYWYVNATDSTNLSSKTLIQTFTRDFVPVGTGGSGPSGGGATPSTPSVPSTAPSPGTSPFSIIGDLFGLDEGPTEEDIRTGIRVIPSEVNMIFIKLPNGKSQKTKEFETIPGLDTCNLQDVNSELGCEILTGGINTLTFAPSVNTFLQTIETSVILNSGNNTRKVPVTVNYVNFDYYFPMGNTIFDAGPLFTAKDNDSNLLGIKVFPIITIILLSILTLKYFKKRRT